MKSLSRVRLFAAPWTVAYQASPSMGFSRQEYWSGLPFPSPGDLPNPGIEPGSPVLEADALTSEPPGSFARSKFRVPNRVITHSRPPAVGSLPNQLSTPTRPRSALTVPTQLPFIFRPVFHFPKKRGKRSRRLEYSEREGASVRAPLP